MKKMPWDIILLHMCTINEDHIWFLKYKAQQTEFFVILGHFLPFHPPGDPENQNFDILKNLPWDIIILHMGTLNDNHMMHGSWDMECDRQNFLSFRTDFCPFTPPMDPENQNFENMKIVPGDIIILHMCTINDSHMIYGSWGMERDGQNVFVFLDHFLPFYPPNNPENQNFENEKKHLEVISFYTCVP